MIILGSVVVIVVLEDSCVLDLARMLDLAGLFVFNKERISTSALSSESVDLVLAMVVPKVF